MSRKLELQVKDIWARKGILKISLELLKDLDLKTAGLIFGKLFIIKADNILFSSYTAPAIEYKCVSAGFDIVKEGDNIPQYRIITHVKKNKINRIEFEIIK